MSLIEAFHVIGIYAVQNSRSFAALMANYPTGKTLRRGSGKAAALLFFLLHILAAATVTAATYDVEKLGVPRFVSTNYIDVSKIFAISKFRSGTGHNYSDDFERCRSMKHYFMYPNASAVIQAPVSGTITRIFDEWAGTQVQITSAVQPAFTFILFHVALAKPLAMGDHVQEGQVLGTHVGMQTFSDIAVGVNVPGGYRLVSYFETLTDTGFAPFKARGITDIGQLVIPRAERDAAPFQCNGENFTKVGAQTDSEYVNLNGSMPPTAIVSVNGPVDHQRISALVSPPDNVYGIIGSLFVAAVLPQHRGGTIYFLRSSGAWVPFTGCSNAPAYQQGQLFTNMGVFVIGTPTDLRPYQGVSVYAGYGLGYTWETACNNMLLNTSFTRIYTLQ